jgi:hypothetical protein
MHKFLKFIFGIELYMFRTVSLIHYQESSTVHKAIQAGYADGLLTSSQRNLYDIYLLLCTQYWTPGDGQKTSPKHAEFYSKNKFEKLVYLVGFIIRLRINKTFDYNVIGQL